MATAVRKHTAKAAAFMLTSCSGAATALRRARLVGQRANAAPFICSQSNRSTMRHAQLDHGHKGELTARAGEIFPVHFNNRKVGRYCLGNNFYIRSASLNKMLALKMRGHMIQRPAFYLGAK
jgi:hypothetical protein